MTDYDKMCELMDLMHEWDWSGLKGDDKKRLKKVYKLIDKFREKDLTMNRGRWMGKTQYRKEMGEYDKENPSEQEVSSASHTEKICKNCVSWRENMTCAESPKDPLNFYSNFTCDEWEEKEPPEDMVFAKYEDKLYGIPRGYILVEKSDLETLFKEAYATFDIAYKEVERLKEKYLPEYDDRFDNCETEGEGDNIRYL